MILTTGTSDVDLKTLTVFSNYSYLVGVDNNRIRKIQESGSSKKERTRTVDCKTVAVAAGVGGRGIRYDERSELGTDVL